MMLIRATIEVIKAPEENISIRTSYNLAGIPASSSVCTMRSLNITRILSD